MVGRELDVLAAYVHGALAFGHALGLAYNVRRRNKTFATIHGAALAFDLWAAYRHYVDAAPKTNYQLEAERKAAWGGR